MAAEPAPPSGTVTFLFTDIEGSTGLWEDHRSEMELAVARHDEILRSVIESRGGYVFTTAGDSFAAAFSRAVDAIDAALSAREALGAEAWPGGIPLQVRIGVHTGEAQERDSDYFGPAVNLAARVMSAAHGGQVLVSDTTRQIVDHVDFGDLGEHRLRGVSDRVRIWQLGAGDFGSLRSGGAAGNLPTPASSFLGRVGDIEQLKRVITTGRTVTLVGVGGVGKTRLAIEVAAGAADEFTDGVWFCDLAPVGDPVSVIDTVAAILGVRQQAGGSMLDAISDAGRGRRMLLVLDNCEHVLGPAAQLAAALNARAHTVAVLATSREPLGVAGEQVWPVPSLDAAVDLFLARAGEADAGFDPETGGVGVIEAVCAQLDNMPLAIELAAARVRSMTVADIEARLGDRFRLLRGSGRGGLERHQTLTATVQWSYDLLTHSEQALFDRLCVFAGSFDPAAAEAVCGDGTILDEYAVLDGLTSLVDKSMVVADREGSAARYRLLETFRQFGEHRIGHDLLIEVKDRHLDHYLAQAQLAERLALHEYSSSDTIYRTEWDNIRAAMAWAVAIEDQGRGATLLEAAHGYAWWNLLTEVGEWAQQLIELGDAQVTAYGSASFFRGIAGDFETQVELGRKGLERAGWAITAESSWCWGPYSGGLSRTAGLEVFEPAIRAAYQSASLHQGGQQAYFGAALAVALAKRQPEEAARLAAESERLLEAGVHPHFAASTLIFLSRYAALRSQLQQAADRGLQALEISRTHDLPWDSTMAATHMAFLASLGALPNPEEAFRDAIEIAYRQRAWFDLWPCLHNLVRWWIDTKQLERAGILYGHITAQQAENALGLAGIRSKGRNALEADPDHLHWFDLGAGLDRDQAIDYALEQLS